MKILCMNLNGNDDKEIKDKYSDCNLFAYQESTKNLTGRTKINTVIIDKKNNDNILKGTEKFKKLWEFYFPWLVFPENYFSEIEYMDENSNISFKLVNVHLAAFYSGKKHLLEFVLLERLKELVKENKNVILLGDFNAQKIVSRKNQGSQFLEKVEELGFEEIFSENEKKEKTIIPTYYYKERGLRYDHVYIRRFNDFAKDIEITYYPEYKDGEKSISGLSDHRGIILEWK